MAMEGPAAAGAVTQIVGRLGHIESFDESASDWPSYEERLSSFLQVNRIPEDDKVHAFLSLIGPKTYSLLKSLTAPELPSAKSFELLKKLLGDHLSPKPSVISERAKFHRRAQLENESISEYVAQLRKLAQTCEFESALDQSLRDRFVCGLCREDIQRVLFTEDNKLTFQKAVERALAMEAAKKSVAEAHASESSVSDIHKVGAIGDTNVTQGNCYRCGSAKHASSVCPHIAAICFKCAKKGHIQRVCQANQQRTTKGARRNAMKVLSPVQASVSVKGIVSPGLEPVKISMHVQDVPLEMELDTGATVSVMSFDQFRQMFPSSKVMPTTLKLRTFNGAIVQPVGVAHVAVNYGEQKAQLPFYIMREKGPPLLGRQWLQALRPDWSHMFKLNASPSGEHVTSSRLRALLDRYQDLFQDELGTITEERAELFLKEGSVPKFMKARSVPFALQPAVEAELKKLEDMGVISPVVTSDYATPVVPVVKKDGGIRLCGDYKTTLNPCLETDRYPLPRIDELFTALAGGQEFSKIDLNRAYQQVVMSESSRKYWTLNTHKGLFSVNRLPFGVSSAPSIFQRIMDTMLKDLKGVSCYLDDVLITGKTSDEHFANLEAVLKRLTERGVRVKKEKCSFFQTELQYLGHVISAAGVSTTPDKIEALLKASAPTGKQQLQSFLGIVNYYGKFVPRLSTLASPLYKLLKRDQPWIWDKSCQGAFEEIKNALVSSSVLAHYDPDKPLQVACDASQYGVGAVLSHVTEDGSSRPVFYASRTLTDAEKKYSQLEKEALAIIFAVKKFHFHIYGRCFTLITDHKPLQTILGQKNRHSTNCSSALTAMGGHVVRLQVLARVQKVQ